MKRILTVLLVASVPVAAYWALKAPLVDSYLTRKAPGWARELGVELRLGRADFDPWGPSLRVTDLEVRPPGGEWAFRAQAVGARVRFFRSLSGTLHLEAEAVSPRFEGELRIPGRPGHPETESEGTRRLPALVLETLLVRDGALAVAIPALDVTLNLPQVGVDWVRNRGRALVSGGVVGWHGEEEALETLAFEGERRFATLKVSRFELKTQRLGLEAAGRVGPWRLLDLDLKGEVSLRDLPGAWVEAAGLMRWAPVETALAVAAKVGGTRDRPQAQGTLSLEPGSFSTLRLEGGSAQWTLDPEGVSFRDLEARSSAGVISEGEGRLRWGGGLFLEARGRAVDHDLREFMGVLLPGWFPVGVHASGTFEAEGPLTPELALECRAEFQARGLDVTVGEERTTVFALPSSEVVSNLTVGREEIRFGPTRVETPSASLEISSGRIVYREGLWLDTELSVRDLELVRAYVPRDLDARGRAVGSFGGSYDELVFEYDLDLSSALARGEDLGRLRGRVRYDLRDLTLDGVTLEGTRGEVTARGTVGLYPGGEYRLEVGATVPDIQHVVGLAEAWSLPVPADLGGLVWARGTLGGPLPDPVFEGEVGAEAVLVGGFLVSRAVARVRASAETWTLENAEVHAADAVVGARGAGDREGFRVEGTLAQLRPAAVARALGGESPVDGELSGDFRAEGPYGNPEAELTGTMRRVQAFGHPLGEVNVQVRYREGGLEAEARAFGTGVLVKGELGLTEPFPVRAVADLKDLPWRVLPPALLPDGLEAESLSGRVGVSGFLGEPAPRVEVSWSGAVEGALWQGLDLGRVSVEGRLGDEGLRFGARAWGNEAAVSGFWPAAAGALLELDLVLQDLALERIRSLAPVPEGRVAARGRAAVSPVGLRETTAAAKWDAVRSLSVEGALTGVILAGGVPSPDWTFRGEMREGRPELRVESEGVLLRVVGEEAGRGGWEAELRLERFSPSSFLPEEHPLRSLEGVLTTRGNARGTGSEVTEASAGGAIEGVAWAPLLPSDWEWSASWKAGAGFLEAREARGAAVRGRWSPGKPIAAELQMEAVPLQGWVSHPAIPEAFSGEASGGGVVRWSPQDGFSGRLDLSRLVLAVPPMTLEGVGPVRLSYDHGEARVESLRLKGSGLEVSAHGGLRPGETWDLDVDASLDLGALRGWTDGVRRGSGSARAEIELRGPWQAPRLAGPIVVEPGAALSLEAFDLSIEDLEASGYFDADDGLIVEWLDAQVGFGRVHLEGAVGLDGFRPGRLRLLAELRNIAQERPPRVRSLFDADLLITGTYERPEVRGDIRLKEFLYEERVNLKTLVFDAIQRRPREVRGVPEAGTVFVDVSARGDDNLRVENNLADLSLALDLRVRGYLPRPALWGRVEVREGTVRLRSLEYEVLRSSVEFLGETQPVPLLDLHVRTQVRQYTVNVDISGPLDDYQVALASMPPMPQNDIVALLTLGSTAGEMQDAQSLTAAEAASFLTGRFQDELEGEVGELLGFDQFQIDPAYSPSSQTTVPRVTVGKAVTRSLYARYSAAIGGETEQDFEVQYSITPRFSLLGTWNDRGSQSQGSLGGEARVRFTFR